MMPQILRWRAYLPHRKCVGPWQLFGSLRGKSVRIDR